MPAGTSTHQPRMVRQSQARPARGRASRGRLPKREVSRRETAPDIYQEMLEEAEARDPEHFHSDRPIKRRKVGDSKAIPTDPPETAQARRVTDPEIREEEQAKNLQIVYDLSETDESDVEWEDVDIQQPAPEASSAAVVSQGSNEMLQITLEQEPEKRKKTVHRRKPLTAAEKKIRLDVHKVHLLCLLAHVNLRNRWCNDDSIQVPVISIETLVPDPNAPL